MENQTLPAGWTTLISAECFDLIPTTGKKVKTKECLKNGAYPVIDQGQEAISGYVNDEEKIIEVDKPVIIFGDHTRAVKWVESDFVPGADGTKPLLSKEFLIPKYAFYHLKSLEIPDKGYSRHFKFLKELYFLIAPLEEQKVIAEKLDKMLAEVETAKAQLTRTIDTLKQFRQSVLAAAVNGKLTEEWRNVNDVVSAKSIIEKDALAKKELLELNPSLKRKKSSIECDIDADYIFDIPIQWAFTTWGQLSEWITYGFTKPMPKSENGVKLLTAKDVQYFDINISEANFTTVDAFNGLSEKDKPQKGDLLITKDGSIGRAALVKTDLDFCINQSVAVCWLRSTSMNKTYLELLVNSDFTQKFVKAKAQGMAIQHLSIIDFAKCPLPIPPLEEQTEIVSQVEALFAEADKVKTQTQAALNRVNQMTQSILAKAFHGELTADWREQNPDLITGDNSAEVLLAKIQEERAKQKPNKRTKAKR